ncbi:MAG: glycosyltransferase, partial [Actinomycetes bacterium]
DELRGRSFDVTTAALAPSASSEPLPFVVLGPGRTHPRTLLALVGAARSHDVIVAHGGPSLQPAATVAAVTRRPFIYRNIGDPEYWSTVPFSAVRIGAPLRRAEQVVALSPGIADWLIANFDVPASRVTVIPNAVDVTSFPPRTPAARQSMRASLGLDDDTFVLGYLGALSAEKRPLLAVEATAARPGAHLVLAGDGPQQEEVEEAAARLAPGRVHLLGTVRRPAEVLAGLDALLLPSRTEGMPASLIEAALVGVPVVATAVGTVPDLLDELGCGTAVPVDSTESFVATVRTFDPTTYDMDAARTAAMRYDVHTVVDQWGDILRAAPHD